MIVYLVTNLVNGKQYVGQTLKSLRRRWMGHQLAGSYLYNAIRKYGKEYFNIEVLNICLNKKAMDSVEKFWIKTLNTLSPNGYNILKGGGDTTTLGMLGKKHSEETKRKIGDKKRGIPLPQSEESKLKISEAIRGVKRKPFSEEWKRNLSLSRLGKKRTEEQRKVQSEAIKRWHKMKTEEQRKLFSLATTGRKRTEEQVARMKAAQIMRRQNEQRP